MNLKTRLLKLQTRSKIVIAHALRWMEVWGRVYLRGVPQLILVALLLVPVVYLSGRYIEAFFQIIALFALRYKFPKTYHAKECNALHIPDAHNRLHRDSEYASVEYGTVQLDFCQFRNRILVVGGSRVYRPSSTTQRIFNLFVFA